MVGIGAPSPARNWNWVLLPQFLPGSQVGIGAPSPARNWNWVLLPSSLPPSQVRIGAPSPARNWNWVLLPQFLPGSQVGIGAPSPEARPNWLVRQRSPRSHNGAGEEPSTTKTVSAFVERTGLVPAQRAPASNNVTRVASRRFFI